MDSGDKLGEPSGSRPSGLDAWSLIQLGWIEPTVIPITPRPSTYTIFSLESPSGTRVLKIALTQSLYYLIELRTRAGLDVALPEERVMVWLVNETALDPTRPYNAYGVINCTQSLYPCTSCSQSPFEDPIRKVFIEAAGCSGQECVLRVASALAYVSWNAPSSTEAFWPYEIIVSFVDTEHRPLAGQNVNLLVDGAAEQLTTNDKGEIHRTLFFCTVGEHHVEVTSSFMSPGSTAYVIIVRPPYVVAIVLVMGAVVAASLVLRGKIRRKISLQSRRQIEWTELIRRSAGLMARDGCSVIFRNHRVSPSLSICQNRINEWMASGIEPSSRSHTRERRVTSYSFMQEPRDLSRKERLRLFVTCAEDSFLPIHWSVLAAGEHSDPLCRLCHANQKNTFLQSD